MSNKKVKYIHNLEEWLNCESLSVDIYYVLENAINGLKNGHYKKEEAEIYIIESIDKLQSNSYEFTTTDKHIYDFVKTKENKGIINSIAYSIANACRLL